MEGSGELESDYDVQKDDERRNDDQPIDENCNVMKVDAVKDEDITDFILSCLGSVVDSLESITITPNNNLKEGPKKKVENKRTVRRVSFADSVGLELASIRVMTEGRDTPPNLENFLSTYQFTKEKSPTMLLQPQFLQPIQDYNNFQLNLNTNCVALESLTVINSTITGVVKVRNIAYEKTVTIFYSTDDWNTKNSVICFYVNPLQNTVVCSYDAFSFQLEVEKSWPKLEFYIEYKCYESTFWDNNYGRNYLLLRTEIQED